MEKEKRKEFKFHFVAVRHIKRFICRNQIFEIRTQSNGIPFITFALCHYIGDRCPTQSPVARRKKTASSDQHYLAHLKSIAESQSQHLKSGSILAFVHVPKYKIISKMCRAYKAYTSAHQHSHTHTSLDVLYVHIQPVPFYSNLLLWSFISYIWLECNVLQCFRIMIILFWQRNNKKNQYKVKASDSMTLSPAKTQTATKVENIPMAGDQKRCRQPTHHVCERYVFGRFGLVWKAPHHKCTTSISCEQWAIRTKLIENYLRKGQPLNWTSLRCWRRGFMCD